VPNLKRGAERLFNFPRLYRLKFAVTGLVLRIVRPLLLRTMVTVDDVLASAQIPAGSRICEIGCGDGDNYRRSAAAAHDLAYTGIDINPAMIAHCAAAYPTQRWLVAVPPYPFADGAFDYCLIVNVLHHLDDDAASAAMLAEAGRIARTVLLFEPLQSEFAPLARLKRVYWALTDGGERYQRLHEFHALFARADLRLDWERASSPLRHFYGARLSSLRSPSTSGGKSGGVNTKNVSCG
jgi:hypothetical protein